MTKSFDEWFEDTMPNTHKGVGSQKIETFAYETAKDAWNFKQSEVDELQKRIDDALHEADESCGVSVDAFVKLNRILKGDSHES